MKSLLILIGVLAVGVTANVAGRRNICNVETQDGRVVDVCCEGWTGLDTACVTPVCEPECELNGGTCEAPNVCTNCPEDRVGANCERFVCLRAREDHKLLSWQQQRQTFKPTCLRDGSYTVLQCSKVSGMCYCVNRWTGAPYVNTYTRGVPDCSRYSIDERPQSRRIEVLPMEPSNVERPADIGEELPQVGDVVLSAPCRAAHDIWQSSRWSFFTTEPVCDVEGYYVNQRCYPLYGYCICIDRNTGVEIESSKLSRPTIDCTDVVAPRPEQVEAPEPEPEVPIENGCTWEGTHYNQDETFYRDCNLCTCVKYGLMECTTRTCSSDACHFGESDKVAEYMINGTCHRCLCNHGEFECSVVSCDTLTNPVEVEAVTTCDNKPPQTTFFDECNSCYCFSSGVAPCTKMGCFSRPGDCYLTNRYYQNGQEFTRGCDTLRCREGQVEMVESCAAITDGMIFVQTKPEVACEYEGEEFFNGESMLLGLKMCKCQFFNWDCQVM